MTTGGRILVLVDLDNVAFRHGEPDPTCLKKRWKKIIRRADVESSAERYPEEPMIIAAGTTKTFEAIDTRLMDKLRARSIFHVVSSFVKNATDFEIVKIFMQKQEQLEFRQGGIRVVTRDVGLGQLLSYVAEPYTSLKFWSSVRDECDLTFFDKNRFNLSFLTRRDLDRFRVMRNQFFNQTEQEKKRKQSRKATTFIPLEERKRRENPNRLTTVLNIGQNEWKSLELVDLDALVDTVESEERDTVKRNNNKLDCVRKWMLESRVRIRRIVCCTRRILDLIHKLSPSTMEAIRAISNMIHIVDVNIPRHGLVSATEHAMLVIFRGLQGQCIFPAGVHVITRPNNFIMVNLMIYFNSITDKEKMMFSFIHRESCLREWFANRIFFADRKDLDEFWAALDMYTH